MICLGSDLKLSKSPCVHDDCVLQNLKGSSISSFRPGATSAIWCLILETINLLSSALRIIIHSCIKFVMVLSLPGIKVKCPCMFVYDGHEFVCI